MKKLTIISMAALLLLAASCKKEKETEPGGDAVFRATTETHSGDSKTQLDDQKAVIWNSGDAIKVFNASGTPCEFTAVSGGLSTTSFGGTAPDGFFGSTTPSYTAFYPSSEGVKFDGSSYKITLPATQTYAENSFGQGANPMAAVSTTTELSFKNICGLLKLKLYSEVERTVKSITLTSTGEKLWGTGAVNLTNPSTPTLGTLDGGGSTLTLDCSSYNNGQGVTLGTSESSPTVFYFVVPANTLQKGFTVKVTDGTTYVWEKIAPTQTTSVDRSKILTMPSQTVSETHEPVTPSEMQLTKSYDGVNFTASGSFSVPEGSSYKCEYGFVYSAASSSKDDGGNKIIVHSFSDDPVSGGSVSFEDIDLDVINDGQLYDVSAYAIVDGEIRSEAVQMGPRPCPWTNGTSPYAFSISATKKVYFSKGNLQYNPKQKIWRFAEHQFDVLHKENADVSSEYTANYDGWIDMFGWGTSGHNYGTDSYTVNYEPYSTTTTTNSNYGPSGSVNLSVDNHTDWGCNPITNGGTDNDWYTPSGSTSGGDLRYILISRTKGTISGTFADKPGRYTMITVGGQSGMLIFPDVFYWTPKMGYSPVNHLNSISYDSHQVETVDYSFTQFAAMEEAGAVFLPFAGYREGTALKNDNQNYYWTSTCSGDSNAIRMQGAASFGGASRNKGYSVRLVKKAN